MPRVTFWALGLFPLLILCLQLWDPTFLMAFTPSWISDLLTSPSPTSRSDTPVVMACMPAFGHLEKISIIAEGLHKLGYPVTLITGLEFADIGKELGVEFEPLDGSGAAMMSDEDMAEFLGLQGLDQELFAVKKVFIQAIPDHHRSVQRVFSKFKEEHGNEKALIFIYDSSFQGVTPVLLGAPGIRPDAAIGVGLSPIIQPSNDTMPFRSGQKPDTSPQSRRIHHEAYLEQAKEPFFAGIDGAFKSMLLSMGTTASPIPRLMEAFSLLPEMLLQYGIPEFEYSRSDLRPHVKYIGASPAVGVAARDLPSWWNDVLGAERAGRRIIAVTSSSVDFNVRHLIIPALEALKGMADVLVVATLVTSDVDTMDYEIPANARVAKFIPLDLLLPHVSILVSNGGYGTVQQALSKGVPMILAGVSQDKAQTGPIAEYAGVGIYLPVQQTTTDMVRQAVDEMLTNPRFGNRARELKERYRQYDPVRIVDETVQEVLGKIRGL